MPAKLKLSDERKQYLIDLYNSDLGTKAIMKLTHHDFHKIIRPMWVDYYGEDCISLRCSRLNRLNKLGSKNPMFGKSGSKHHLFKEDKYCYQGYRVIKAPSWYTGCTSRETNSALEHIIIYCATHNLTQIECGYIIHHKDGDKINNHPDNLEMLTISDHMKLHNNLRKGATTIPQGSTPQESAEAQSIL